MKLKKTVKNLFFASALTLGLFAPKSASAKEEEKQTPPERKHSLKITLSYDYFENKRNTLRIQEATEHFINTTPSESGDTPQKTSDTQEPPDPAISLPPPKKDKFLSAKGFITSTKDYGDFLRRTNGIRLTKNEKISLLGFLGETAAQNYDFSFPLRIVQPSQVFDGVRNTLTLGKEVPVGAICGGIHNFIKDAAQHLGLDAVTYSGRSGKEGLGHVFASVLGNDGFTNISYGQLAHTNTFNFYQSLILAQRAEGSVVFDHRMYDNDFLFRHFTPDAKRFFRFVRFDPTLDTFITTVEQGVKREQGGSIVLGNTELSGAYDLPIHSFSFTAKGGRMYGQAPSVLDTADLAEGIARFTPCEGTTFVDMRLAAVYGSFHMRDREDIVFILTETQAGTNIDLSRNTHLKFGTRFIVGGDINKITGERGGRTQTLVIFDINNMVALEHRRFGIYTAVQLIGGFNNVQELTPTMHLGDIELGTTYKISFPKLPSKIRLAGRLKPEAYVARAALENDYFSLGASYGIGRHGVFTPNYIEADAKGHLPLTKIFSLEGLLSLRHEQWSHGEKNTAGTAQAAVKAEF